MTTASPGTSTTAHRTLPLDAPIRKAGEYSPAFLFARSPAPHACTKASHVARVQSMPVPAHPAHICLHVPVSGAKPARIWYLVGAWLASKKKGAGTYRPPFPWVPIRPIRRALRSAPDRICSATRDAADTHVYAMLASACSSLMSAETSSDCSFSSRMMTMDF